MNLQFRFRLKCLLSRYKKYLLGNWGKHEKYILCLPWKQVAKFYRRNMLRVIKYIGAFIRYTNTNINLAIFHTKYTYKHEVVHVYKYWTCLQILFMFTIIVHVYKYCTCLQILQYMFTDIVHVYTLTSNDWSAHSMIFFGITVIPLILYLLALKLTIFHWIN